MKKYVCSVCGYIYDEATGCPEGNIPPGTSWNEIPLSFSCPLCGAPKEEFSEKTEEPASPSPSVSPDRISSVPREINYTAAELSAIFSNLAKGCEKQYDPEAAGLYMELSQYYQRKAEKAGQPGFEMLGAKLGTDLSSSFATANGIAAKNRDRGALRALKWAEQVSRMINSLLKKVKAGSADFLEDTNVYVCEICGFIYRGAEKPEICPVCKVPSLKMTQIRKGA